MYMSYSALLSARARGRRRRARPCSKKVEMAALLQAVRDAWDTGDTAQIQRLLDAGGQATA